MRYSHASTGGRAGAGVIDGYGQNVGPGRASLLAEGNFALDTSRVVLELPVAAEQRMPRRVSARRDVGTGQGPQRVDQRAAVDAGGQVAAVQHEVGVRGERIHPARDLVRVAFHAVQAELAVADLEARVIAVRNEVNGVKIMVTGEHLADLLDAVAIGVQHDYVERTAFRAPREKVVDERLIIRDVGIDDDQLPPRVFCVAPVVARHAFLYCEPIEPRTAVTFRDHRRL